MSTATATDPNTLLMADTPTQDPRPEPPRDRWGRYLIPHPTTGEAQAWTRATTFAKTCADTFGLEKWGLRMALLGVARRPDILARIASITDPDDRDQKKLLDQLAQQAKDIAGTSAGSNLGSALHSFAESIDLGRHVTIPAPWDADIAAYRTAMADAGIVVDPAHVERIVTVPELELAGTFDRLVRLPDGRHVVADLKTGKDLSYAWGEIAIQLALYAHAATIFDVATGRHLAMPDVDQTQALVMHLPVGAATCTLWLVDIEAGWEMAQVCGTVRAWRKRKNLAAPYALTPAAAPTPTVESPAASRERTDWMLERLDALRGDDLRMARVAKTWPAGCPTKPPWTDAHIDAIHDVLNAVEASWPALDPDAAPAPTAALTEAPVAAATVPRRPDWPTSSPGTDVTATQLADLQATVTALDDDRLFVLARWAREGREQDRRWTGAGGAMTARDHAISTAAIACVTHLWDADEPDDLARAAIACVTSPLEATWWTGAVLGSLAIGQAEQLAELIDAYAAGDNAAAERIGAAQVAAS